MSGARPDTWMPFYIGDYLADTMHLTREQHGAYMLLIFAYWRRGEPLPDDDRQLAATVRATLAEWRRLRPVMAPFFQISDGRWTHRRIDAELGSAVSISEAKRQAGRRGGQAARGRSGRPKNNSSGNGEKIAELIADELQNNTPSPSQSQKEEDSTEFSLSTELNSKTPSPRSRVAARKNSRSRTRQPLPADWKLSEKGRIYARSKGWPDAEITLEAEHFRDHSLAHGRLHADVEAAWRTWVQNAPKFERGNRSHVNGTGPATAVARGFAEALDELEPDRARDRHPHGPVLDR